MFEPNLDLKSHTHEKKNEGILWQTELRGSLGVLSDHLKSETFYCFWVFPVKKEQWLRGFRG